MGTMLKINDINVFYGAIHAIKGVSLEVNKGEIVTLLALTVRASPQSCALFPVF